MFQYAYLHPCPLKLKLRVQIEPKFHQAVWLPVLAGFDIETPITIHVTIHCDAGLCMSLLFLD